MNPTLSMHVARKRVAELLRHADQHRRVARPMHVGQGSADHYSCTSFDPRNCISQSTTAVDLCLARDSHVNVASGSRSAEALKLSSHAAPAWVFS